MAREFRSQNTDGTSKKTKFLPYLIYGFIGVLFAILAVRTGRGEARFGSLTSTLYFVAIFSAFLVLRNFRRESDLYSSGIKSSNPIIAVALGKLSNEYSFLTNVKITTSNNARWEIHYLVIGPNGVFLLEVRNDSGTVRVEPTDTEWVVSRKSKRGNDITKNIHNPLFTVSEKAKGVKEILANNQIEAPVYSFVVFVDEVTIIMEKHLPVVTAKNIAAYIKSIQSEQRLQLGQRKNIGRLFL